MKKLVAVAVLVLCLAGWASGQSVNGQNEDFEDEALGANPSDSWYAYTDSYTDTTCTGGAFSSTCRSQVLTAGFDATPQRFEVSDTNIAAPTPNVRFTLTTEHSFSNTTFYFRNDGDVTDPTRAEIFLQFEDSAGRIIDRIHSYGLTNGASGCVNASNCMLLNNFGSGTTALIDGTEDWTDTELIKLDFVFRWTTHTYNVTATKISNGATDSLHNVAFENAAATGIKELQLDDDGGWQGMNFDQWQLDGGPLPNVTVELNEPSEFDSGLVAFISGLGFISAESQFFFSLILIGIVTVTGGVLLKFMAPGKLKLILVSSMAALVGVLCVFLSMFDLWMYVLALVIAGTVVQGSKEFRSTFQELRSSFGRGARTLEASTGEAVPEAPETPNQEASE